MEEKEVHICKFSSNRFYRKGAQKAHEMDVHSGPTDCLLCTSLSFSRNSLARLMKQVHKKHVEINVCHGCGKAVLSRMKKKLLTLTLFFYFLRSFGRAEMRSTL